MIVYPKAAYLFSRKITIWIIIFVYILGFLVSCFANYYLPCCKFYLYYDTYSYTPLDMEYNYSNVYIFMPLNIINSSITIRVYTVVSFYREMNLCAIKLQIYIFIRISNKKAVKTMDKSTQQMRKSQEIRHVFLFVLCIIFSTAC